jgi:hypothetical protein
VRENVEKADETVLIFLHLEEMAGMHSSVCSEQCDVICVVSDKLC